MQFKLKVFSESAGVSELQAEAASAEEASRQAAAQGYIVLSVSGSSTRLGLPAGVGARRRGRFPLLPL
ncbi:MAG: hypothetical protein HYU75_17870, partial [Betaproteobacteria bacterium]|nr:hypothetical protein [Betaproteobacteria bacterium]